MEKQEDYIAMFGSDEIAIKKRTDDGADTTYQLDFIVPGGALPAGSPGNQSPINILAKPSDFIEAYLEDTEGLVEGVREVFYSNKVVIREIGDSAKRNAADEAAAFAGLASKGGVALANYGLGGLVETMNWVDDRDPSVKIGYDETNQRLTFDGVNTALGKGTGVGFDTFTVYSKKLDAGKK